MMRLTPSKISSWQYELDLTLFGSGATQHVFTELGHKETIWVYKVPVAYGRILPVEKSAGFRPENTYQRLIRFILVRLPRGFHSKVCQELATFAEDLRLANAKEPLRVYEIFCQACRDAANEVFLVYRRRLSKMSFRTMLRHLEQISEQGLSDILIPFKIVRSATVTLHVNDAVIPYTGPILMQRKADYFFERSVKFQSLNWDDLVNAQQRLWRRGYALSASGEILGPKNWALLNGRLYLADTSSLTRDFQSAYKSLDDVILDKRENLVFRQLAEISSTDPAEEYFHYVRKNISQQKLEQLWRADLRNDRATVFAHRSHST